MKKISLALLIVGLLLGQLVRIIFNVHDGFEFHTISLKLLPIADYGGGSSEQFLTSTILGYLAFIAFGVINTNRQKYPGIFKSALMFTGASLVVAFFEFTSIIEDYNNTFQGKHFRIAWLLFFLGLWIFSKNYLAKK